VALTKKYVRREVINHSSLTHPHIVKFRECFLTDKYLAIAMEYAAGGDMFKYVSNKCAARASARWRSAALPGRRGWAACVWRAPSSPCNICLHSSTPQDYLWRRSYGRKSACMCTAPCRPCGAKVLAGNGTRGGLDEKEARWFFKQLILALDYCHKMVRGLRLRPVCVLASVASKSGLTGASFVRICRPR
jgi:serine/threonine protein kinase